MTGAVPTPRPGAGGGGRAARRSPADRRALRTGLPDGLFVVEHAPSGGHHGYDGPVVVLVHGSLDRAASFDRVARRLPDWTVVAYDRRGYQSSRPGGVVTGLDGHIEDLLAVADVYAATGPVTAVGHSVGGTVVLGAAVRAPERFASVAAYEPSMPWLGFYPPRQELSDDPAAEVEQFFRRMVGDSAWERMGDAVRQDRLDDGPALLADLLAVRGDAPFDVTALAVPALIATGGDASFVFHVATSRWVAEHVAGGRLATVKDAAHGAHLTHPDAFARVVREAVGMARAAGPSGAT